MNCTTHYWLVYLYLLDLFTFAFIERRWRAGDARFRFTFSGAPRASTQGAAAPSTRRSYLSSACAS